MPSAVHLISGLPRSGSTLLAAILRQNRRFVAAMTSPVAALLGALLPKMSGGSEFGVFFNDERRRAILRGVFHSYYATVSPEQVVFDTNRTWTGKTALVRDLFPNARIICCVREVGWILDSIERLLRKNPLQVSRIFKLQPGSSVYARAEMLMNSESGLIGVAWSCLMEAWFGQDARQLIVLDYDRLTRDPYGTVRQLYKELGEPWFEHDFEHVTYDEPDYDAIIGTPGLHRVREKVEHVKREPCIPPDLFARYAANNFWKTPALNRGGATVI